MDDQTETAILTPEPGAGQDTDTAGGRRPGASRKTVWIRVALAVLVVAVGATVAFDVVTASPAYCGSCHEIAPRAHSWSQSAHAEVPCVKCHQPPTEWYEVPQRLAARARLVGRDTVRHLAGGYDDPVDGPVSGAVPMTDAVCLQCHDANRKATSGFRILIDHAEHAERNGSCTSCHVRTAHPVETLGGPLSLMAQCFTCHGTQPDAKAPGACGVCHPAGYTLFPASHEASAWAEADHGKIAVADAGQCSMCHEEDYCIGCHGVDMPHPEGWEQGSTGHAVVAKTNRDVCTQCHGDSEDMCTMCHHEAFDPTKGTWVKQHSQEVVKRGTAFCMKCHAPTACVACHANGS